MHLPSGSFYVRANFPTKGAAMAEQKQSDESALKQFIEEEIANLRAIRDRFAAKIAELFGEEEPEGEHRFIAHSYSKLTDAIQKLSAHPLVKPVDAHVPGQILTVQLRGGPASEIEEGQARVTGEEQIISASDIGKLEIDEDKDEPKPFPEFEKDAVQKSAEQEQAKLKTQPGPKHKRK